MPLLRRMRLHWVALLLLLGSPAVAQIIVPVQLPVNTTKVAAPWQAVVSYALSIEGRPYTIHLQQHIFLSEGFKIYVTDEKGSLHPDPTHIQRDCHYRGFIEGFPGSAVTLSTCSGLRGLLQFENVSYAIEPLGYSPAFNHLVYQMKDEDVTSSIWDSGVLEAGPGKLVAEKILPAAAPSHRYLKVHVVLDQSLYHLMGSDTNTVVQKIVQVFGLLNTMFSPVNMTIVLSSLELWVGKNRIPTTGAADSLLQRFLQWKLSQQLVPLSSDIAYLLVYRERAEVMGAVMQGKACQRDAAGTVAVYQRTTNLESFATLLAQLQGRSLGMVFDDSSQCHCPSHICVMNRAAVRFSGAKAFSSCSIKNFAAFLKQKGDTCPFSKPQLSGQSNHSAVCGNGVVELGEQCDCGADKACLKDDCCTQSCQFKPGVKCSSGPCCERCQFKPKSWQCRPPADPQCDFPEFCSGSSASCPDDLYVQDGHSCEHNTGYCYRGRCQSSELQCQRLYGRGSRNAPVVCYEELNSQKDRFGHCGFQPELGYKPCRWRDLRCGKLICTYPSRTPLPPSSIAVVYAQVRQHLCVSLHHLNVPMNQDPLLVPAGTKCGSGQMCINTTCQPLSVLGFSCDSAVDCHDHGVCDNKGHCQCYPGWQPPNCVQKDLQYRARKLEPDGGVSQILWPVLGSCLGLLVLAKAVCLIRCWCRKRQPRSSEGFTTKENTNCPEPDPERDPEPEWDPELEWDPEPVWEPNPLWKPEPERDPEPVWKPNPLWKPEPERDPEPVWKPNPLWKP